MSKDERSLLLFLESCAVDKHGRVNQVHMNKLDFEIAERWNDEGFIEFGRICFDNVSSNGAFWCHLSEHAYALASSERKARAERCWLKRNYKTTKEQ